MFTNKFWNQVEEEVKNGYINVQKHPTESLWIYNYSQSAMFDSRWNDATMHCRGLIVDENKNVVARPFKKFMTLDQCESFGMKIPNEEFEVYDKLDGSLGVMYFVYNSSYHEINGWDDYKGPFIATRGSFTSDQAIEANKILKEKYNHVRFDPVLTYLFEIIYPDNRIVVDYGNKRDLILLAIIETSTGTEFPVSLGIPMGLNVVTRYHGLKDFSKVLNNFEKFSGTEFEGLVIRFESGFRVKIKTEDYKRLHKILSGINEKRIWECLSSGQGLQEILDVVDDSFSDWVKNVVQQLTLTYELKESHYTMMYNDAYRLSQNENISMTDQFQFAEERIKLNRKNFAKIVNQWDDPCMRTVAFLMYGNQNYSKVIWDSIEPKGNNKFKLIDSEEE